MKEDWSEEHPIKKYFLTKELVEWKVWIVWIVRKNWISIEEYQCILNQQNNVLILYANYSSWIKIPVYNNFEQPRKLKFLLPLCVILSFLVFRSNILDHYFVIILHDDNFTEKAQNTRGAEMFRSWNFKYEEYNLNEIYKTTTIWTSILRIINDHTTHSSGLS